MPELWDLYDARRNLTGKTVRAGENLPQGSYHLMVSGWIINSKGEILMVQHHPDDGEYPMLWDCIGGWALSGEDSAKGGTRAVGGRSSRLSRQKAAKHPQRRSLYRCVGVPLRFGNPGPAAGPGQGRRHQMGDTGNLRGYVHPKAGGARGALFYHPL